MTRLSGAFSAMWHVGYPVSLKTCNVLHNPSDIQCQWKPQATLPCRITTLGVVPICRWGSLQNFNWTQRKPDSCKPVCYQQPTFRAVRRTSEFVCWIGRDLGLLWSRTQVWRHHKFCCDLWIGNLGKGVCDFVSSKLGSRYEISEWQEKMKQRSENTRTKTSAAHLVSLL